MKRGATKENCFLDKICSFLFGLLGGKVDNLSNERRSLNRAAWCNSLPAAEVSQLEVKLPELLTKHWKLCNHKLHIECFYNAFQAGGAARTSRIRYSVTNA
jgi:hypothetical protein